MNVTFYSRLFFSSLFLFTQLVCAANSAHPIALKCEYLVHPIGIDQAHPRLTWQMDDDRTGARQTAYQIIVGEDSVKLVKGSGSAWSSPKTASSANLITYKGKALQPFTRYYWRITIWDKDGKRGSTAVSWFETGMMRMRNWKGSWISDEKSINEKRAPYFRKPFRILKQVRSAKAYIAAAGLYELYLNGKKVGNHRLDPMYTRFDRRTLYVSYDVTSQLQKGDNAAGVLLGNGWYNHQSTAVWYFDRAPWRGRPSFCMDLRIIYTDGSVETIVTGNQWKTSLSPLTFNSIYTAEHYDARLEQPGWNTATFDDTKWQNIMGRAAPSQNIVSQSLHPVRNVEEIKPESMIRFNDTAYLFDLGRNISGVSRITVSGKAGTVIRLQHAERLYKNTGRVDMSNIDYHFRPVGKEDPFQVDLFTLSGNGPETFMPKFNYKGFQYIEVTSSQPIQLNQQSITGYFMHSDVPPVGNITSSNPIVAKIWWATNNSYLSNLFGYPTDCPQREKNGWTGDAHIAVETGLYNFDGITIYEKWMGDHRDEQQPNGVLPAIIPTSGWGYDWANGPDWTSTIALIPWNLYLFYGDTKPLADNYSNIKRYVDHIDELYPTGLTSWGLGDWVPVKSTSPVELTSTAYYFSDVTILAKAAKILSNKADEIRYTALAKKIKDAFNKKYLNKEKGIYSNGLQTELSVPLYWGLVPDEYKSKVADNLAKKVEADGNHLDVGILGAKAILNALSDNGHADVAYKLASQDTYPSWGWWMVNGFTTLLENWNIEAKSDISLNHIMFGEIGAWLYKGIAGIKPDEAHPGFKNVLLQPNFVIGLDHFEATHTGPYGKITSAWKRAASGLVYRVVVPANSTAAINMPAGKNLYLNNKPVVKGADGKYHIEAGSYIFNVQ
jgi:alpha-L-rhamnosidase